MTLIMIIILQLIGIVVMAVGTWVVIKNEDFSYVTGDKFVQGAGALVSAGVITTIISIIGIFGCIFKARPLLVIVSNNKGRQWLKNYTLHAVCPFHDPDCCLGDSCSYCSFCLQGYSSKCSAWDLPKILPHHLFHR